MAKTPASPAAPAWGRSIAEAFAPDGRKGADGAVPVWLVGEAEGIAGAAGLSDAHKAWLTATGFKPTARRTALLPAADGGLAGVVLGLGRGASGEPSGAAELLVGQLAQSLPPGRYRIAGEVAEPMLVAVAWGLGAYRFRRYKTGPADPVPQLVLPAGLDRDRVAAAVEAVWAGRDLINTPANDMGPAEIEAAVRALAARYGAQATSVAGDDLIERNFPLVHAVGRASSRAPRVVDLTWSRKGVSKTAPRVTLVGKGIVFDTGGLDIKPASAMLLMKKDMGGAAAALTLAHMVMAAGLDVRLRLLVSATENAISGDAFRPSDVIRSRAGRTVEIGNTDAEGRLVLADALALADEEKPDLVVSFATLTGAARVALGPDMPALFCDDAAFAARIVDHGERIGDPVWRLPFWAGYERHLDSDIADMTNAPDTPFAGAITAALFLRRFVPNARRYVHLDLYGWRPAPRALGPKGGEPQTARALFEVLSAAGGLA